VVIGDPAYAGVFAPPEVAKMKATITINTSPINPNPILFSVFFHLISIAGSMLMALLVN